METFTKRCPAVFAKSTLNQNNKRRLKFYDKQFRFIIQTPEQIVEEFGISVPIARIPETGPLLSLYLPHI